jgi:two-component system response regulator DctR
MAEMMGAVHLVDDDPGVRDALTFLLRSRGLTVRAFDGGPALLEALDREGPRSGPPRGVFLLDVRMEPMTGCATPCCS